MSSSLARLQMAIPHLSITRMPFFDELLFSLPTQLCAHFDIVGQLTCVAASSSGLASGSAKGFLMNAQHSMASSARHFCSAGRFKSLCPTHICCFFAELSGESDTFILGSISINVILRDWLLARTPFDCLFVLLSRVSAAAIMHTE